MKSAGIGKARQDLSALLDEVRKGRPVTITDRGRPVARLVPVNSDASKGYSSHRLFRAGIRLKGQSLSSTVERDREDRV